MKSDKEAAPSGISFEMSKAAGDTDITFLCNLIKYVMIQGEILEDWEMSFVLSLLKGKGDDLNRDN